MLDDLSWIHWLSLHGLITAAAVLCYVLAAHVGQQRRHPAAAIAWMLFILLLPYVALPAFLAFGKRKRAVGTARAASQDTHAPSGADWPRQTLAAFGQPDAMAYRGLNLHLDGAQARQAIFAILEGARHSVDVCTFLIGRDRFGHAIIDALCTCARRGVKVRVLVDGLGWLMAGRPALTRLTEAGAVFALFAPPIGIPFKAQANLRNHRKLLLADAGFDGSRLWCGGRNLAAEYFTGDGTTLPWRDLSFDLQGALCHQAHALFEHDWAFATGTRLPPQSAADASAADPEGAQVVAAGPDQADDPLYALLVTAAYRAERRIAVATPYFVPEAALLMGLCLAARRGVQVDVLLPARSNHRLSDIARRRALRALSDAGARLWLAPAMLHAKLAVIDDSLALAGSANLDSRSLFLNYELMVAFHKPADIQRFTAWFDHEREQARRHTPRRSGLLRDMAEGMLLWLAFQL